MKYNPEIHHRKSIRTKGHDYSQTGFYFVTICTHARLHLFGNINNGIMKLNAAGEIANTCWLAIPEHFPNVVLHAYIIMPDHIHGIIELTNEPGSGSKNFSPLKPSTLITPFKSPSRTIGSIVRGFKIGVTKWFRQNHPAKFPPKQPVWQRNYHDRIIQNEKSFNRITKYIINNPGKWEKGRKILHPFSMNFQKIWETHKSALTDFIKSKIDDPSLADDILQEVSIKLFDNLERKTGIQNHKAWLYQVARNTIADHYRKNKKTETLSIDPETSENPNVCFCDLSGFIIQTYLPKKYSEPLYLSDIEQKSQKEIAETLNLSLTATKSRIQRGRKKLKELIADCIDISYNNKGQIIDFELKTNCNLPPEILTEIKKLNLTF